MHKEPAKNSPVISGILYCYGSAGFVMLNGDCTCCLSDVVQISAQAGIRRNLVLLCSQEYQIVPVNDLGIAAITEQGFYFLTGISRNFPGFFGTVI